jgi:hypothetical protein
MEASGERGEENNRCPWWRNQKDSLSSVRVVVKSNDMHLQLDLWRTQAKLNLLRVVCRVVCTIESMVGRTVVKGPEAVLSNRTQ